MTLPVQTVLDDAQLGAVMRAYRDPLERYATHLLNGDYARGQDVVQDTFERLLRQDETLRQQLLADFTQNIVPGAGGGGRIKAWLFTVCRNRALDIRRKERRMTPLTATMAEAQTEPALGPAMLAQQHDAHDAVLKHMAKLPANQQEVLRLRFHSELTYPQIAQVTGLTPGNVGYLLHHALKTLRQQTHITPQAEAASAAVGPSTPAHKRTPPPHPRRPTP